MPKESEIKAGEVSCRPALTKLNIVVFVQKGDLAMRVKCLLTIALTLAMTVTGCKNKSIDVSEQTKPGAKEPNTVTTEPNAVTEKPIKETLDETDVQETEDYINGPKEDEIWDWTTANLENMIFDVGRQIEGDFVNHEGDPRFTECWEHLGGHIVFEENAV